jgi:hypothetical protein
MKKSSFADRNCAVAQTLERIGEWWTLLILQNAFCGMKRFDEFRKHEDDRGGHTRTARRKRRWPFARVSLDAQGNGPLPHHHRAHQLG